MSNLFRKSLAKIPEDKKLLVAKLFDITGQIMDILKRKGMSMKEFAELLGENEDDVRDWMVGTYNFTEETISKIEIALGEPVTLTINQAEEKYGGMSRKMAEKENQIHFLENILKQKGIEPGEYRYAVGA